MKKYSFYAFQMLWGDIGVRLFSFLTQIYCARVLGTEGFGLTVIGNSFLLYAVLLSDIGFKTIGFIETAKFPKDRTFSLRSIISARILHTTLTAILCFPCIYFIFSDPIIRNICLLYLSQIFFDALFLEWYYKGTQKFSLISFSRTVASASAFFCIILYVKTPIHVLRVPIIQFLTNILSAIILIYKLPTSSIRNGLSFSLKTYSKILIDAVPIGIGSLLTQVSLYLPPLLIGKFFSKQDSGFFGAAMRLILLVMTVDRIFSTLYVSSLPKFWKKSKQNTQYLIEKLLKYSLFFGSLLCLIISINSSIIIDLVYGKDYSASGNLLYVGIWFVELTICNSIIGYGLIGLGEKKLYFKASLYGFFLNCFILFILIYFFSSRGASWALLCTELVSILFFYQFFNKICPVPFYKNVLKTVGALIGTYSCINFIKMHILLQNVCSVLFFVLVCIILKSIAVKELYLFILSRPLNNDLKN